MVKRKKVVEKKVEVKPVKQEEELFCDDLVLTNEQLLEIKYSHLEREVIQKDVKVLFTEIQLIDRQKELLNLRMSDLKNRAVIKDRGHREVIENVGRKVGKSLNDSQINFETGRVTFS